MIFSRAIKNVGALLLVFLCTLILVIGVLVVARAYKHKFDHKNTITVIGHAQVDYESDKIYWIVVCEKIVSDIQKGMHELVHDKNRVVDFLIAHGISTDEIRVEPTEILEQYPIHYEYEGNKRVEKTNRLRQTISVHSFDIDKVEKVYQEISSLHLEGVYFSSGYPVYIISEMESIQNELLALAAENAYKRAEEIAQKSEQKVDKLLFSKQKAFHMFYEHEDGQIQALDYAYSPGEYEDDPHVRTYDNMHSFIDPWSRRKVCYISVENEYSIQ